MPGWKIADRKPRVAADRQQNVVEIVRDAAC
jgi:hypothetical protein